MKVTIRYPLSIILLALLIGYCPLVPGLIERDPLRLEKEAVSSIENALDLVEEISQAETLKEAQRLAEDVWNELRDAIDDLENAIKSRRGKREEEIEPEANLEAYFAYPAIGRPEDDQPENIFKGLLNSLNPGDRIDIAMYAFTDRDLRNAVEEAANRNVRVRLYLERDYIDKEQGGAPTLEEICKAGPVEVRLESPPSYLMHHKYAVINDQTVITGSYNWSNAADTKNWENLLVIQDQEIADEYNADFKNLWDNYSIPFCE